MSEFIIQPEPCPRDFFMFDITVLKIYLNTLLNFFMFDITVL